MLEVVRETPGDVRRRAAETEAQCTAASYAPDPCSVSSEALSTAVGTKGGAAAGPVSLPAARTLACKTGRRAEARIRRHTDC